jgi:hypothetical protein
MGSTDYDATRAFFLDGLGFKPSDQVPGLSSFMRCSTDHHNVLVLPAPVDFIHHTSWQVDDIDEVGRGATASAYFVRIVPVTYRGKRHINPGGTAHDHGFAGHGCPCLAR